MLPQDGVSPGDQSRGDTALQGSRCPQCAVVSYPAVVSCPRCGAQMSAHTLSQDGVVWSWTVQRYAPKSPPYVPPIGGFRPFVVAYVELTEGIRVEAVMELPPEDRLMVTIGDRVRLAVGDGVPRAVPR
jgi:uncharacterized OB-fold protein